MGVRRIVVTERLSTTDEWYFTVPHRIPGLPEYVRTNFTDTGVLTKSLVMNSANGLQRLTVWEWPDQASYDTYYADSEIQNYEQHRADFYANTPNVNVVHDTVQSTDEPFRAQDYLG